MISENQHLVQHARQMLASGADIQEVISYLRDSNCSKIMSIRIVMELTGASLNDAKWVVHYSRAWADVKEQDEEFHRRLDEELHEHLEEIYSEEGD